MTTLTHHTTSPHNRRDSRRRAGTDLLAGLPALLAVALVTRAVFDLPASYLLQALACYAATAALVFSTVPGTLPGPGLGPANRVTLARATVLLPVAALVWQPGIHHANGYWWIIAVSTVAMITDGLDGWTARRSGTATSFGARFDMELDALLMLALALLVALSGKVGPWVVSIGVLRYLFVIAGWLWPTLNAELPPQHAAANGLCRAGGGPVGLSRSRRPGCARCHRRHGGTRAAGLFLCGRRAMAGPELDGACGPEPRRGRTCTPWRHGS